MEDDEVETELVPLDGEEEGAGSFLGIICSHNPSGNLDPSDTTTKTRRVKSKQWFLQEPNMVMMKLRKDS